MFNIGDKVKIVRPRHIYPAYSYMAKKMKLKYWKETNDVQVYENKSGIIINKALHPYPPDGGVLYGVRVGKNDVIIEEPGIALVNTNIYKRINFRNILKYSVGLLILIPISVVLFLSLLVTFALTLVSDGFQLDFNEILKTLLNFWKPFKAGD